MACAKVETLDGLFGLKKRRPGKRSVAPSDTKREASERRSSSEKQNHKVVAERNPRRDEASL